MKKAATFIPYTLILFFLLFGNTIVASAQDLPPPGLEPPPPPVNIDLYMIPMVGIGILLAFFFIRKNTDV
ncbi:hypothetical protein ACNQGP_11210 [Flavobacterium sp. GT2N3]|uniref:hypothetical protein n=1 Tax=unclassified Flavobacterium TaxID=196869 RepID=UPI003AADE020